MHRANISDPRHPYSYRGVSYQSNAQCHRQAGWGRFNMPVDAGSVMLTRTQSRNSQDIQYQLLDEDQLMVPPDPARRDIFFLCSVLTDVSIASY